MSRGVKGTVHHVMSDDAGLLWRQSFVPSKRRRHHTASNQKRRASTTLSILSSRPAHGVNTTSTRRQAIQVRGTASSPFYHLPTRIA